MQDVLERLGIPLSVVWTPENNRSIHGEIRQGTIYIYDHQESEAFATFTHEVIEFKLREVTKVYRVLINNLIDGYEKLAYQQKEDFIEFIPKLIETQKQQVDSH
jgi:hypothetical protein